MRRSSSRTWKLVAWRERPTYRRMVPGQVMHATRSQSGWLWGVRRSNETRPYAQGRALTRRRAFLSAELAAGLLAVARDSGFGLSDDRFDGEPSAS